ncbi:MAG: hypothetical protein ACR2NJ_03550 [Acidimicrobiales bacterium]
MRHLNPKLLDAWGGASAISKPSAPSSLLPESMSTRTPCTSRSPWIMMLWPYDDQCRLLGEDVWEFDTAESGLFKLDPADVLTAEQAGQLLDPFIQPLPAFDDAMLPS